MENTQENSGQDEAPILHKPDTDYYDLRFMLPLVENYIDRATGTIEGRSKDTLFKSGEEIRALLDFKDDDTNVQDIIGSLSSQITSEILNGNDAHNITVTVLDILTNFGWGDKVVLTLTAFALTFGELWLRVRIYADNVVNEPTTGDQRELLISANKTAYKNQIETNNEFIKRLVNPYKYLLKIGELSFKFHRIHPFDPLPTHVYWIIRCSIVAATQIIILSSRGLDQDLVGIREPIEFDKLKSFNEYLKLIQSESENGLKAQKTIIGFMRLIVTDKDVPPLFHGSTKRRDHLNVLRGNHVLLLISGIDIAIEDIMFLTQVLYYITINSRTVEIVWIPVINRLTSESSPINNQLESLQKSMPWYSVHQPSLIKDDAIELFKTEWDFKGKPILVVLSPTAEVLNKNAIHMIKIWPNLPVDHLTSEMERQLWENETWNLKFLVNDIDPIIHEWIQDERYILMFGGNDDIDWIRNFIRQAHSVASNLHVHIETIYIGKSRLNEDQERRVHELITREQLSHCLLSVLVADGYQIIPRKCTILSLYTIKGRSHKELRRLLIVLILSFS
ncbi:protein SIEVE ELEMENT OCCLUSION B-like [Silene latifolia]|uniref:protein SIEVE ELEMENT OCCLUSION B-like n=1 Tax=Silene latifolia TaxID=37657 RepID=UPI003D778F2C